MKSLHLFACIGGGIPAELSELLDEYEQFYKITNDIVDVYKATLKLFDKEKSDDKELIQKYFVKTEEWIDLKRRFVKEVRIDLINQFRAIRDALNPDEISNEALNVFSLIRRLSYDIDNNILFLYGTLNV